MARRAVTEYEDAGPDVVVDRRPFWSPIPMLVTLAVIALLVALLWAPVSHWVSNGNQHGSVKVSYQNK